MPTRPFSSVANGSTVPLGQVRLPVTFGSCKNYHTELIDFDVVQVGLPYNAILGYPALTKFMAVTHHAYNTLVHVASCSSDTIKLPGCNGTITIRCDEKDAMRTLKHAYKAADTAYTADEDKAPEKQEFIIQEVEQLQEAGIICEVLHPEWIANPIVIPKPNGNKRMCVDFTNLNKACPKDPFPLP
ncbi:uncharacterized protein [Aegilops tauschii subsp. strangulata]|uniref:uncharacterized protein n=1 Tax=Aegilops tauschii subsp. strangulata TaxID=200361 RepID=UPI003CC8A290